MFDKTKTAAHRLGAYGEKCAVRFLRKNGYRILKRNYITSFGEIDIICSDRKYIVFVEVKSRTDTENIRIYGRPANAVNREKKAKLVSGAYEYLNDTGSNKIPRIDIIEVYISPDDPKKYRIEHLKSAVGE